MVLTIAYIYMVLTIAYIYMVLTIAYIYMVFHVWEKLQLEKSNEIFLSKRDVFFTKYIHMPQSDPWVTMVTHIAIC